MEATQTQQRFKVETVRPDRAHLGKFQVVLAADGMILDFARTRREAERLMAERERLSSFKRWYSCDGHWVYDDRARALQTWIERGIEGLPPAPATAAVDLAGWVGGGS